MLRWAIGVWVLGLVSAVPYGTWYLLMQAPRDEYALLIVSILFWVFGYWAVVGPLLAALKLRAVMRAVERLPTQAKVREALRSEAAEDVVVELIAAENGIPRLLALEVYRRVVGRLTQAPPR
jgi:hypothetical protein